MRHNIISACLRVCTKHFQQFSTNAGHQDKKEETVWCVPVFREPMRHAWVPNLSSFNTFELYGGRPLLRLLLSLPLALALAPLAKQLEG